jgi:hypothetical protein
MISGTNSILEVEANSSILIMKNRQPSLMVHTNPEFENFEFDQHLGSHKHVINIIMWFRDMGCYIYDGRELAR